MLYREFLAILCLFDSGAVVLSSNQRSFYLVLWRPFILKAIRLSLFAKLCFVLFHFFVTYYLGIRTLIPQKGKKYNVWFQKISISPTEGTFVLEPQPPEFPFQGMLVIPPIPSNFRKFPTWLGSPGKNISVKNAVALYFFAKDNCFCDKERKKIFLFMLMPCRGLSQTIIK